MKTPALVAKCCAAMRAAVDIEVTVKCRIGVDNQVPQDVLPEFLAQVSAAGISRFAVHARKAWLDGLSPKENRDIPPLDYDLVMHMKGLFPALHLSVNGGITSLEQAQSFLEAGLDGVMIGRMAYHQPSNILALADHVIFGADQTCDPVQIVHQMLPYIEAHMISGGKLNQITRHMLGMFASKPGARAWRRVLSERGHLGGPELVLEALSHVDQLAAA
jgi:tRNA-dihydrouridine synthase A